MSTVDSVVSIDDGNRSGSCTTLLQEGLELQWQEKWVRAYKLRINKGKGIVLPKSRCAYLLLDIAGVIGIDWSGGVRTLQADEFLFSPPQNEIRINGDPKKKADCVLLELK